MSSYIATCAGHSHTSDMYPCSSCIPEHRSCMWARQPPGAWHRLSRPLWPSPFARPQRVHFAPWSHVISIGVCTRPCSCAVAWVVACVVWLCLCRGAFMKDAILCCVYFGCFAVPPLYVAGGFTSLPFFLVLVLGFRGATCVRSCGVGGSSLYPSAVAAGRALGCPWFSSSHRSISVVGGVQGCAWLWRTRSMTRRVIS